MEPACRRLRSAPRATPFFSLVPLYMSDKLRIELITSGLTGTCSLTQFVLVIAWVFGVGPALSHVTMVHSLAEANTWQHNVCSPD